MSPIYDTIGSPLVPSSDQLFRPAAGDYSAGADGGIYLPVGTTVPRIDLLLVTDFQYLH